MERNIEAGQRAGGTGKNQKIMQGQGRQQAELSAQHEDVLLHQNIRKLKHVIQWRGGPGLPHHKAQGWINDYCSSLEKRWCCLALWKSLLIKMGRCKSSRELHRPNSPSLAHSFQDEVMMPWIIHWWGWKRRECSRDAIAEKPIIPSNRFSHFTAESNVYPKTFK